MQLWLKYLFQVQTNFATVYVVYKGEFFLQNYQRIEIDEDCPPPLEKEQVETYIERLQEMYKDYQSATKKGNEYLHRITIRVT